MTTPGDRHVPRSIRIDALRALLDDLYGPDSNAMVDRIVASAGDREASTTVTDWSEDDVWLITYPDQFQAPGEAPLATLNRFFSNELASSLTGVHILPCYPFTSDDGYAVTNYLEVDSAHGEWSDVERVAAGSRLMLDAVVNHMSAASDWFLRFLDGDPEYAGFFRTANPDADLSATVRPRTSPLLTRFEATTGPVWVWTTFSADQVDLDFRNAAVFVAVAKVLLAYASHGARMIRLDAVQFLAKQEGTTSINLPEAHQIVRALRAALDVSHPDVLLVSESNVPHEENLAYLGGPGEREAQVIYQFALAPLVLHTMLTGDTTALSNWAKDLPTPRSGTTYLNYLASHDGVAVRPVEEILPPQAVDKLVELTRSAGGEVNSRALANGTAVPYELASTWFDLMAHGYDENTGIARHLASHAIMLGLQGIPAVYVHSMFGTGNDRELAMQTGMARSLNRHKFTDLDELEAALTNDHSRTSRVAGGMRKLIGHRRSFGEFHPDAGQVILETDLGVFGIERGGQVRLYVNVTPEPQAVAAEGWRTSDGETIEVLGPHQVCWLSRDDG